MSNKPQHRSVTCQILGVAGCFGRLSVEQYRCCRHLANYMYKLTLQLESISESILRKLQLIYSINKL